MPWELAPTRSDGPESCSDNCKGLDGGSTTTFSWRPQPQAHAQQVTFHLPVSAWVAGRAPHHYTCRVPLLGDGSLLLGDTEEN